VKEGIDKLSQLRGKYTLVENSVEEMRDITSKMELRVENGLTNIQKEFKKAMD